MITDSYSKLMPEIGMRSVFGGGGGGAAGGSVGDIDIEEELGLVLREQQRRLQEANDRERELSIFRSGSAPPTVEGSINAVGGLFSAAGGGGGSKLSSISEEELRSDPAYVSYYYSNVNLNPRLPPPLLSKEDWRLAQRLQGGGSNAIGGASASLGGIGDRRTLGRGSGANNSGFGDDGSSERSLFSMQPTYGEGQDKNGTEAREDWGGDGLIGLPGLGLGSGQKSIAEMIQDDMNHASVSRHPSRPSSRAFDKVGESSESQFAYLDHELPSTDGLGSGTSLKGISTLQNIGSSASHTYAAALGASLSRSITPDPQLGAKAPTPRIPLVGEGRTGSLERRNMHVQNSFDNVQPDTGDHGDLMSAFSGMNLSSVNSTVNEGKHLASQVHREMDELLRGKGDPKAIKQHSYLTKPANSYLKGASTLTPNSAGSSPTQYPIVGSPNSSFYNYGLGGYAINPSLPSSLASQLGTSNLPPLFENIAAAAAMGATGVDSRAMGGGLTLSPNLLAAATELQNLSRVGGQNSVSSLNMPALDPLYLQYLRSSEYAAAQLAALNDPTINRETLGTPYMEMLGLQKAYLGALLSAQKSQYGLPFLGKSGGLEHGYYGNPAFGSGISYPGSPLGGPLLPNSPLGSGSPVRHGNMRFPTAMRNLAGGVIGSWHSDPGSTLDESFMSSLLDEFKNNKTKSFELAEIVGHVVEFSADQFGSRFIQQKLETASIEEKNMVFHEIMPQALSLMTDVFGNYVIQKFFEHGSAPQIRELADQLTGHVLTLSLQMYGCRVIQKAIEVVELDQQTKMVAELDGHVMRCVRDQNGNHVVQKCIECIPEDAIQFIVSTFYDQVVTLSTHPYGCRVIQRVLEHCHNPKTQSIMMDEILKSVVMLAQDQYGNYVVQHVLQHGEPHERSAIITKLIGQIVHMSQQKFASNVVEKCLSFGTPEERKTLVNEMLGSTDENEPLQVMMKDQFANYVVQKVLETCDDQQLELILNRIKVHLNALKKYTYGKHIVARVEKLVAAGERRIGILNSA